MPKQDLGHVYELRTQQGRYKIPMTPITGKSVITELKLGKQLNNNQYTGINPGGSIISLVGKDVLGPDDLLPTPDAQTFMFR
jgi:hypothetical protein